MDLRSRHHPLQRGECDKPLELLRVLPDVHRTSLIWSNAPGIPNPQGKLIGALEIRSIGMLSQISKSCETEKNGSNRYNSQLRLHFVMQFTSSLLYVLPGVASRIMRRWVHVRSPSKGLTSFSNLRIFFQNGHQKKHLPAKLEKKPLCTSSIKLLIPWSPAIFATLRTLAETRGPAT